MNRSACHINFTEGSTFRSVKMWLRLVVLPHTAAACMWARLDLMKHTLASIKYTKYLIRNVEPNPFLWQCSIVVSYTLLWNYVETVAMTVCYDVNRWNGNHADLNSQASVFLLLSSLSSSPFKSTGVDPKPHCLHLMRRERTRFWGYGTIPKYLKEKHVFVPVNAEISYAL